jgi:lipopolysaccharide transport system ATP-binding protein
MSDFAIEAKGLGKHYFLGEDLTLARLARGMLPWRRGDGPSELWALRNASFTVKAGEAIGIIGRNGAGKSTLLKLLSRITAPSEGHARLRGRISTLLEVGTGFHPELSGRDNIFLSGTILGMSYREVTTKFDQIVAFAGVEQFIDTPVKRYSSGMYVRLAFAVAAFLEPEILIVDEVLAVGDAGFQRKSLDRLNEVSGHDGRTVLFVSHNLHAIRTFCKRALLLEKGQIVFDGPTEEAISRYLRSITVSTGVQDAGLKDRLNRTSGAVRFTEVVAINDAAARTWRFHTGETVRLRFRYAAHEAVPDLAISMQLRSAVDNSLIAVIRDVISPGPIDAGRAGTIEIELPNLPLQPGEIALYVALMSIDDTRSYDVVDDNVDLPLLVIVGRDDESFMRQGLISLTHKLSRFDAPHDSVRAHSS